MSHRGKHDEPRPSEIPAKGLYGRGRQESPKRTESTKDSSDPFSQVEYSSPANVGKKDDKSTTKSHTSRNGGLKISQNRGPTSGSDPERTSKTPVRMSNERDTMNEAGQPSRSFVLDKGQGDRNVSGQLSRQQFRAPKFQRGLVPNDTMTKTSTKKDQPQDDPSEGMPALYKSADSTLDPLVTHSSISEVQTLRIGDVQKANLAPLVDIVEPEYLTAPSSVTTGLQTKGKEIEGPNHSLLFQKRPISPVSRDSLTPFDVKGHSPSQSGSSIGRSKSQLTLLLERDSLQVEEDTESAKPHRAEEK